MSAADRILLHIRWCSHRLCDGGQWTGRSGVSVWSLSSRARMGGAARSCFLGEHWPKSSGRLYDKHGCGLSDRDRTDFSLDSEVRTIEAIVKELGLKSLVLWDMAGREPVRL